MEAAYLRRLAALGVALLFGPGLTAACAAESPERTASPEAVVITAEGLGCARIGDPVERLREACDVAADTVLQLEGTQRALRVRVDGAHVIAEIVEDRVWRLSVLETGPLTPDSIGVGTPFPRAYARLDLGVHAGEGRYFAVPSNRCGISFELDGIPFEGPPPTPDALLEMGSQVRISRVLVLGC